MRVCGVSETAELKCLQIVTRQVELLECIAAVKIVTAQCRDVVGVQQQLDGRLSGIRSRPLDEQSTVCPPPVNPVGCRLVIDNSHLHTFGQDWETAFSDNNNKHTNRCVRTLN